LALLLQKIAKALLSVKLVHHPWWSARCVRNWFTRILMKQSHKSDTMHLTLNNCPLPETKESHYNWHLNTPFFINPMHPSEKGKWSSHFYTM
jgi:hypothetical protein